MTRAQPVILDMFIGARSAFRQRRRSLLAMVSIAFGVVSLVLASGFIDGMLWATREASIQSGLGHVQIVRHGFFTVGLVDPYSYLLSDDAPELAVIERLPHVRTVAPRLSFSGLASSGDTTLSFIGEAVSPTREANFAGASIVSDGHELSENEPNGIMLGRGLAANLSVSVGDTLILLANTKDGGINAVECRVRGLFSTVSKVYDDTALRVPLPLARELLRIEGVHRWIVMLDKTEHTDDFLQELRGQLQTPQLQFVPWYDMADYYHKSVKLLSAQMTVVFMIIILLVVLAIFNTMLMSVLERTREIGTSLALGATRRNILRRFMGEALAIGMLGGGAGLAIGVALAWLISLIGIPIPPPPGQTQGYVARILISEDRLGESLLVALVTALAASAYPAWRASRTNIVESLRHST